jgi:DNA-binding MarR family transcriptional regulator
MERPGEVRTLDGEAATEVILATFRANGLLLGAGDLLAQGEGLTSARWQVLGAVALAERPLTVPQIARRMGLTRQSVHATVRRLVSSGLVQLAPNADHQRSPLVRLTELGQARYQAMERRQAAWVNRLARGLEHSDLKITARVLGELCRRLDADTGLSSEVAAGTEERNEAVTGTARGGTR